MLSPTPHTPLQHPHPRRLSDLVGADIGLHVGKNFLDSFPERCYPARIILVRAQGWGGCGLCVCV